MAVQTADLTNSYTALAPVYEQVGLADYAQRVVLDYIAMAQALDWAGRRIIELGCGTGVASWMLADRGFRVLGIDTSAPMLVQARIHRTTHQQDDVTIAQEPPEFAQMDIRRPLDIPNATADMVLAVDGVINALLNLTQLQQTFAHVAAVVAPGKLFVFDVWTIRGLAEVLGTRAAVLSAQPGAPFVVAEYDFQYENLSNKITYTLFTPREAGSVNWARAEEHHILRSFPTEGIVAMLDRTGFDMLSVVDPVMQPFDPQRDAHGRAVFVAQRRAE